MIKGISIPHEIHKAYILEDIGSKDPSHIMKRMFKRNISADEVQGYVDNAILTISQRKGERIVYYADNGVTDNTKTSHYDGIDWIAKTTWSKYDFDENALKILEVARKYAK